MPFFGESEKEKKIRERADAAARKAESMYPELRQEEEGVRASAATPKEAAVEALGEGGSLMQAAVMAANPKSVLSKMKGKMPVKPGSKSYKGLIGKDDKEEGITIDYSNTKLAPTPKKPIPAAKEPISFERPEHKINPMKNIRDEKGNQISVRMSDEEIAELQKRVKHKKTPEYIGSWADKKK